MKVPTKSIEIKIKEEVVDGVVCLKNGAEIHIEAGHRWPAVRITMMGGYDNHAYFDGESARQAAAFFNNIANVLEGKEQVCTCIY